MMKKILVVAAMATFAASAFAQATVYGRVSTYVDNTKTGTAAGATNITGDSSRIGFSVNEDLGRGMSARVVVETSVASDNPKTGASTQLGDRQSTVGLANALGTVDLGRKEHAMFLTLKAADPFATIYGSSAVDVHNKRDSRIGDGVFLTTGARGVGVAYDRSQDSTISNIQSFSVGGNVGPARLSFARWEQGVEKTDLYTAVGKFNNTTLYYAHSQSQGAAAATNRKGNSVAVRQQLGSFAVKASYGENNADVSAYSVGGEYNLSKRTDVMVALRNVSGATASADVKQYGVGLVHRF